MKFSFSRAMIIARREYLTTVRRKAFVFSLMLTPAILYFSTFLSGKLASDDARAHQRQGRIIAFVDSSGLYAAAPRTFTWDAPGAPVRAARTLGGVTAVSAESTVKVGANIRPFADQKAALDSLDAGTVNTVIVVGRDFLERGTLRRYERDTRAITSSGDDGPVRAWLTRALLAGHEDSARVERTLGLSRTAPLYVPARAGGYELKDDAHEMLTFFLPFILAFLLGMSIVNGGQYLLQGVAEEKETRILESLLCTVTADDLMVGKLFGLGAAGLTLVGTWIVLGVGLGGSMLAMMHVQVSPVLVALGLAYFLLGYLFYGSLMTGIGAVANNLREAQQFAVIFTMSNFFPFYVLVKILNSPNSAVAVAMSLIPPTAPTTMMLRLASSQMTGTVIPAWQVGASLGLLALAAILALAAASKIFRLGLLLYGKTPNLPEILAILRQK